MQTPSARRKVVDLIPLATFLCAALSSLGTSPSNAAPARTERVAGAESGRLVEVRSYNLKPGTRGRFHELVLEEAMPMLRRAKIDVVTYGPSLHDDDSYYLMRSFSSVEDRQRSEEAFYGSAAWKQGPREDILALIESYTTIILRLDEETLRGLRDASQAATGAPEPSRDEASDIARLTALNQDYVDAVRTSNVKRFEEILAQDFLCTLGDGRQIDRQHFLKEIAQPMKASNLELHDVNVRLMGDFAIVHARTTYTTEAGQPGESRYTDVWARRDGRWLAVSAQITRVAAAK